MTYSNTYQIGIPSNIMNQVYALQRKTLWCWSTCIEIVLKAYGIRADQSQIAKIVCPVDYFGFPINCAADQNEITKALRLSGFDIYGNKFKVIASLKKHPVNLSRLYVEIMNNKPVIVAYKSGKMQMGHAVIISGAECRVIGGEIIIEKLFIRDPDSAILNQINNGRKVITSVAEFIDSIYAHWYIDIEKTPVRRNTYLGW